MLDIKFIRENVDKVKKAITDKRINLDLEELLDLDEKRRDLLTELESVQATKNQTSKDFPKLSAEEKKVRLLEMKELDSKNEGLKEKVDEVIVKYQELMYLVPNIPSPETPIGADSAGNVPWRYWNETLGVVDPTKDADKIKEIAPKFDFEIKDHIALGKELDLIDTEAGVKTSGFRGYYLKNEAVLMQYGLIWLALKKMQEKGFTLMVPPVLVREAPLYGSGHFPAGRPEIYQVLESKDVLVPSPDGKYMAEEGKENVFLAGTSEPSLLAYYADKTLNEKDLPIKISGVSSCYRSEIGSYGKDTKGIYRIHEFMKVEQVVLCKADIIEGDNWLENMREIAESMLQDLKLPYRVLNICTGDMGAGKYKMYDIETWMPARKDYGETHSDSNLTDWQARRLNIKYKTTEGKTKFVYTLNNTVIASPRILIAILENYQQKDGSIIVPDVLKPYVGKDVIGGKEKPVVVPTAPKPEEQHPMPSQPTATVAGKPQTVTIDPMIKLEDLESKMKQTTGDENSKNETPAE
ncbi:MAG TPA: serine--tRNA ligase [Candidatus Limnocylindria bacterium]|nr:serine--tRNA ligase [Candidatus Limnocylindria bacterium]